MLNGSPAERQGNTYDQIRISRFSYVGTEIQKYYRDNKKLPDKLSELSIGSVTDPQSSKEIDYKKKGNISYELCTTFSTDSDDFNEPYKYATGSKRHTKGYNCLMYSIPGANETTSLTIKSTPGPNSLTVVSEHQTIDEGVKLKINSVEKVNDEIQVTVEIQNSSNKSLSLDLSSLKISNTGYFGTAFPPQAFPTTIKDAASNSTTYTSIKYKSPGEAPYTFLYLNGAKKIKIGTTE